jgi:hypothetical protein
VRRTWHSFANTQMLSVAASFAEFSPDHYLARGGWQSRVLRHRMALILTARKADISCAIATGHITCYRQQELAMLEGVATPCHNAACFGKIKRDSRANLCRRT